MLGTGDSGARGRQTRESDRAIDSNESFQVAHNSKLDVIVLYGGNIKWGCFWGVTNAFISFGGN